MINLALQFTSVNNQISSHTKNRVNKFGFYTPTLPTLFARCHEPKRCIVAINYYCKLHDFLRTGT